MDIRPIRDGELATVMSILDGGLLTVTPDQVRTGETFVALLEGCVVGALVLDGCMVVGVAVRPGNRGQGVGAALVEAATVGRNRLIVEFDPEVRPFYDALGFDIEPVDGSGRLRGVRTQ